MEKWNIGMLEDGRKEEWGTDFPLFQYSIIPIFLFWEGKGGS